MASEYDTIYTLNSKKTTNTFSNRKTTHPLWPILLCIVLASFVGLFYWNKNRDNQTTDQVAANQPFPTLGQSKPQSSDQLLSQIKSILEGTVGTYSIYVYDLKKNEGFGIHEQTVLTAASVAKIPILASLYYLAEKGEIDLDQTITLTENDIQDFGTGTLRYATPGTVYSIKTLARLMMEKSDNTAAYILGRNVVGFPRIQKLVTQWNMTQTDMENNKTSAKDISSLMTKMYRREIVKEALSREMLGFMTTSDFEDRIPALLPKGTIVYHKTGDEIGNMHDVGIVEAGDKVYYIGLFALDFLKSEDDVRKGLASVSKLVYDYFL